MGRDRTGRNRFPRPRSGDHEDIPSVNEIIEEAFPNIPNLRAVDPQLWATLNTAVNQGFTAGFDPTQIAAILNQSYQPDVSTALEGFLTGEAQTVGGDGQESRPWEDLNISEEDWRNLILGRDPAALALQERGLDLEALGLQQNMEQFMLNYQLRQAEMNAANARAAASSAVAQGNLALAREQFAYAQQQDEIANRLSARAQAATEAGLGIRGFEASEQALQGRGGLEAAAAGNLTDLTNILGNLGLQQQQLGLDILTTPRNAVAAFLLGQGQSGDMSWQQFNPSNILGIDAAQFQSYLGQAQNAINALLTRANQPQEFDIGAILSGLSQNAGNIMDFAGIREAGGTGGGRTGGGGGSPPLESRPTRQPTGTVTASPTNRVVRNSGAQPDAFFSPQSAPAVDAQAFFNQLMQTDPGMSSPLGTTHLADQYFPNLGDPNIFF